MPINVLKSFSKIKKAILIITFKCFLIIKNLKEFIKRSSIIALKNPINNLNGLIKIFRFRKITKI